MAKITAWLVTVIGAIMVLGLFGIAIPLANWITALAILVIGITKLMRNYRKKKK